MLRLCVQNGREFSIKKGNQNNLFCLNTKKICVWPSCAIYLYVTQHQNVYLFSDTQSHRVPRGGLRGHGEILSPFTRVNVWQKGYTNICARPHNICDCTNIFVRPLGNILFSFLFLEEQFYPFLTQFLCVTGVRCEGNIIWPTRVGYLDAKC